MGQLIACATADGVVVATDSRATMFEPGGEERYITLNRILPVTSHAVLASAGNWQAQDICNDFVSFAKAEGITDIKDLIDAAIPFFTSRYDEVMRIMCQTVPPDPIVNMYLLLAGYSTKTPDHPSQLFIIWDRPKPPKIEYNQVTEVFTLPRRMGLEFRLNQLVKSKAPVDSILNLARNGMEALANQDEDIGGPFRYVTITAKGIVQT
jgi:20S proteasome alpha/beta subunit